MSDFDPYHKWLGIAPEQQPPHHYRLLGISPFEADADVIQNAADQRMAHLRTFQTGRHAAQSQRLLNEVATAMGTLLDPARKQAYDDALRRALAPRPAPVMVAPAAPARPAKAPPPVAQPASPAPLPPPPVAPQVAAPAPPIPLARPAAELSVPRPTRIAARRRGLDPTVLVTIVGVVVMGLMLAAGLGLAAMMGAFTDTTIVDGGNPPPVGGSGVEPSGGNQNSLPKPGEAPAADAFGLITVELPRGDRAAIQIEIDGAPQKLPAFGAAEFSLPLGKHEVTMHRQGYLSVRTSITLTGANGANFNPNWLPDENDKPIAAKPGAKLGKPGMDGWLQDFEEAKRVAAREGKDIFIAFTASDASAPCAQFISEVLAQPEFHAAMDEHFVRLHIDSPRTAKGLAAVKNRERNSELVKFFRVKDLPTTVFVDSHGQVYGVGRYAMRGVDPYLREVTETQAMKAKRDELLARVDSSTGAARAAAADEVFEWLRHDFITHHYLPTLQRWRQRAQKEDPQNKAGQFEVFFEAEMNAKLLTIQPETADKLPPLLKEMKDYLAQIGFKNPNRGARMCLLASLLLTELNDPQQAADFANLGLQLGPQSDLRKKLEDTVASLKGAPKEHVGTGFAVAPGYVLVSATQLNGSREAGIRFNNRDDVAKLTLVASDEVHNLALLQSDDPDVVALPSLKFSRDAAERSTPLGVIEFVPPNFKYGKWTFNVGVVTGVHETADGPLLLLGTLLHDGAIGSPVISDRGLVIGMVTGEIEAADGQPGSSIARPSEKIAEFLGEHLPKFGGPVAPAGPALDWNKTADEVYKSTVAVFVVATDE